MKRLEECTVTEVDWLIDHIGRNMPLGFEKLAMSGSVTKTERQNNQKLDAMCKALERRRELVGQSRAH